MKYYVRVKNGYKLTANKQRHLCTRMVYTLQNIKKNRYILGYKHSTQRCIMLLLYILLRIVS